MKEIQCTETLEKALSKKTPDSSKQMYKSPTLRRLGEVRHLTQGPNGSGTESANTKYPAGSDRRIKEYIMPVDVHPFGFSLYLFDYKPEYRDTWGHGRQFGVMADEVERVMPEAVSVHLDGYKMVNYAMLGISRNLN